MLPRFPRSAVRLSVALLTATVMAAFAATPASAGDITRPVGASDATDLKLPPPVPGEIRRVELSDDGVTVIRWIPKEYLDPHEGGVGTQNASNCGGSVCNTVTGSGLYVATWDTTGFNVVPTCTWATWYNNTTAVHETDVICAALPGAFIANWAPKRNFTTGLAANTWFSIPGTAAVILHS